MSEQHIQNLTGKTILVTGACGILGVHMVKKLKACGASPIAADLPVATERAQEVLPNDVPFHAVDLSDIDDIERFCIEVTDAYGPLAGLINNAASKGSDIGSFMQGPEGISYDTWREVSAVNVDGTFFLTRRLGQKMTEQKAGAIVFIGSIYGELGPDPRIYDGSHYLGQEITTPPVYSATKAAVSGLARYLATQWGSSNVRVNCLCPGGVASGQNDVFEGKYSNRIPMARMARADEIAGPVAFLLSDEASYITGQTLMVDGGLSAW